MTISPIKEAWRSMYQMRTCPPFSVINNPEHSTMVAEHRKGCPLCLRDDAHPLDAEAWAALGRQLVGNWPRPGQPEVLPGQIWSLVAAKGGWDERFRHINPPLVLVLELFEDVQGVRVAQIFDQPELSSHGDVALGDHLGFAQAWNTYALDQTDLDLCYGQVDEDTVSAVRQAQESVQADVDEESTLWFFRQLELEVGAFMAMEAMGRLMTRHDRNEVRAAFADKAAVRAKVLAFDRTIDLPDASDGLRMVVQASLPRQRMAAATSKGQLPFTVVSVGRETNPCRGALAEISHTRLDGSTIRITGMLPEDARHGLLFVWWRRPDKELEEGEVKFDQLSGMFRADFHGKNELDFQIGDIMLLLVVMDDEEDQFQRP